MKVMKMLGLIRKTDDHNLDGTLIFIIYWLVILTGLIFFLILLDALIEKLPFVLALTRELTFLFAAGASLAGGAAFGFLFGLPRAEKYRFVNKPDTNHNANNYSYSDNSNLEDISDWLTKIFVGLTLVKLNLILHWIDLSAHSIDYSFNHYLLSNCQPCKCCKPSFVSFYVFGYSVIILYFLAGGFLCYIWARTNLTLGLTASKVEQGKIDSEGIKKQMAANQSLLADHLTVDPKIQAAIQEIRTDRANWMLEKTPDFKSDTDLYYNSYAIPEKSNLKKGIWGGNSIVGDLRLQASYKGRLGDTGLYQFAFTIRSSNSSKPLVGPAAFFLNQTFPVEIFYTAADDNNQVILNLNIYRAFIIGARLEMGKTVLELDLNSIPDMPVDFYWKE